MWIPESTSQLEQYVRSGALEETDTFDAKERITSSSKEVAKDIAAMSTDGGVILYGVGEDSNGHPIKLTPLELSGQPERIANIVQTCISEPPTFRTHVFKLETDSSKGYIAVEIPPSPRAPHMVIVGGDNRYYGRSDKRNVSLSEGEIERLYHRRETFERDAAHLLDNVRSDPPIKLDSSSGHLHLILQPVVADPELLYKLDPNDPRSELSLLIGEATSPVAFQDRFHPDFKNQPTRWRHDLKGYVAEIGESSLHDRKPRNTLDLRFGRDGSLSLFCGRAVDTGMGETEVKLLLEAVVAGLVRRTCFLARSLYRRLDYLGPLNIAILVTGLEGALSVILKQEGNIDYRMTDSMYERTIRLLAMELIDGWKDISSDLYMPLIRVSTQRSGDPFRD